MRAAMFVGGDWDGVEDWGSVRLCAAAASDVVVVVVVEGGGWWPFGLLS